MSINTLYSPVLCSSRSDLTAPDTISRQVMSSPSTINHPLTLPLQYTDTDRAPRWLMSVSQCLEQYRVKIRSFSLLTIRLSSRIILFEPRKPTRTNSGSLTNPVYWNGMAAQSSWPPRCRDLPSFSTVQKRDYVRVCASFPLPCLTLTSKSLCTA